MSESRRSAFSISRGCLGAIAGGIGAVTLVAVIGLAFEAPWNEFVFPFVGCAAIGAGAGWASLAPRGHHRFANSLALVFVGTLAFWFTLALLEVKQKRHKGEVDLLYPSEGLFLVVPPLLVALVVSGVRANNACRTVLVPDSTG